MLRQQRWKRRRRGVNANPSMFRLCPAGSVKRCCGLPGVGGPSARRVHDPPNLRAQCKQTRNFCQEKIGDKAQNLGARCLMRLSLVVMFRADTTVKTCGASGNFAQGLPPNHTTQLLCIVYQRCAKSTGHRRNFQNCSEFRPNAPEPGFQGGIREPHSSPSTRDVHHGLGRRAVKLVAVLTDDSS